MQNINIGDIYEVYIDNMAHEGQGVGRLDGIAVFVKGALKGEKVLAQIDEKHKNYLNAHVEKILLPSQERIMPKCIYAGKCGGCTLQHLSYKGQLEFKKQVVDDSLSRIGKINTIVYDTIGMDNPLYYRDKAEYPVGIEDGNIKSGFYASKSHNIIAIDSCMIQSDYSIEAMKTVREWANNYKITVYDKKTGKGLLRHVITKIGFATKEVMVIVVVNGKNIPHKKELVSRLKRNIENVKSVVLNVNKNYGNQVMGNENIVIYGHEYITDFIGDKKFEISPLSFFQVNPVQTKVLYEKALEYADLKGDETVFDVYCGIGTISIFFAEHARKVYGIEVIPDAVEDARRNAAINGVDNTEFIAGKAEDVMKDLCNKGLKPDVVVFDPPRKGLDKDVVEASIKMNPEKIIYVSCNPTTLARDLRIFEDNGYKIKKVQPVDMFPYTYHVETVVLMSRKEDK
ncbi:23S rRNA (uracil(1939)-C(5))-methyltransferase RlmD [Thermoanaerobacterium sp. CMT5567-10]|uniref:23S rRNA (uracil(1939)-C(5))-methyltransferase RlmD n=1 Tax=Thermoanaerobacterium sp. CMT5567-10 TaxID=3061989 RepID=UPI0026DFD8B0|nr:23S rRNA (uracil(1939)-C(5))-methyltransferase RlmD [Thermoanaerobacterium sp. CMT5567-10]WKV08372.1 23S rRNA (uracil(1939)-C(5))-methyltransferase RlmD [Thermoanaerobacterium sp. CMT5567-10]